MIYSANLVVINIVPYKIYILMVKKIKHKSITYKNALIAQPRLDVN